MVIANGDTARIATAKIASDLLNNFSQKMASKIRTAMELSSAGNLKTSSLVPKK
jgi:hypothetical protein